MHDGSHEAHVVEAGGVGLGTTRTRVPRLSVPGRVDEDGYFIIEERKKDMLKVSGFAVFPAEVEGIMYRHPAIAEVGVVGVADPYRGEEPVAFVVLKPDAKGSVDEGQLIEWCRANMSVYKAPRQIQFVDSLPRTASGKMLKRVLRDQASAPKGN